VHESREAAATNGAPVKRDSLAIGFERAANDEIEIERSIMRLVLQFRWQISFRLEDFAAADPAHGLDHRAPVKAKQQVRRNQRQNRGGDQNEEKLASESDSDGVELTDHLAVRSHLKTLWIAVRDGFQRDPNRSVANSTTELRMAPW